jgi:hypothetical protein
VKPQKPQLRNPHNLPVKICATCGRPYTWRRLNSTIYRQQRRIDELEALCAALAKRLAESQQADSGGQQSAHEIPPHY